MMKRIFYYFFHSLGSFNFIAMDIQMPAMNVLEATRAIRPTEACKNVRIQIVGVTAKSKKQECINLGMDAFIQKLVTKVVVLETILKVISINSDNINWYETKPK